MVNKDFNELLKGTLDKIEELCDMQKVMGSPFTYEDKVIIPLGKVSFLLTLGGKDLTKNEKNNKKEVIFDFEEEKNPLIGGCASFIAMTPLAFLVIENVKNDVIILDKNEDIIIKGMSLVHDIFKKK
jgi:uncharacterized spore protein YtfJ